LARAFSAEAAAAAAAASADRLVDDVGRDLHSRRPVVDQIVIGLLGYRRLVDDPLLDVELVGVGVAPLDAGPRGRRRGIAQRPSLVACARVAVADFLGGLACLGVRLGLGLARRPRGFLARLAGGDLGLLLLLAGRFPGLMVLALRLGLGLLAFATCRGLGFLALASAGLGGLLGLLDGRRGRARRGGERRERRLGLGDDLAGRQDVTFAGRRVFW
jgi:hypothetical protein